MYKTNILGKKKNENADSSKYSLSVHFLIIEI